MESVLIAAGGLLAVGSLSGLGAAVRVGSLERRIEVLERSRRTNTSASTLPASRSGSPVEALRVEAAARGEALGAAARDVTRVEAATAGEALRVAPLNVTRVDAAAAGEAIRVDVAAGGESLRAAVRDVTRAEAAASGEAIRVDVAAGAKALRVDPRNVTRVEAAAADEAETVQDRWNALELLAGTRWTSWLGAAALVIAAALLVKLAVEEDWLGPSARFALGTAGALGLLVAGWRAHRADMRVLAHGLLGAGLGVLYISLHVASATHSLLPSEVAFGAMVAVTIAGCALALALDAQALATLAWLGGLATPVLVPSVIGSRDLACTYVLVLAMAGSTCAAVRRWPVLALAVFACSAGGLGTWLVKRHDVVTWRIELVWLAAFHIAQQLPVAILAWRRSIPQLWSGLAFANAVIALGCAATIVDGRHHVLGGWALALASIHAAMGVLVRRRTADETSRLMFPALAIAMTTAALPLLVPAGGVTFAWSIEAVVLIALVREPGDARLRQLALALLALTAVHASATAHGSRVWIDQLSIASVPVAAWLFAAIHHRRHPTERALSLFAGLGGLAFLLVAISVELFRYLPTSTASGAVPAVWATASLVLSAFWCRTRAGQHAAAATTALAAYLAYVAYRHGVAESSAVFNVRCAAAVSVLLASATLAVRSRHWARAARFATLAGVIALVGAEIQLHAGTAAHAGLSIGWATLAGILLAIGFIGPHRALRATGLGLLGFVALKLVLVDLAGAPPMLRVISFVVIGTVMIAASYGYHRLASR